MPGPCPQLRVPAPRFQDQVEAADSGGPGVGRGGNYSALQDISIALFLSPKPAGGMDSTTAAAAAAAMYSMYRTPPAPIPAAAAPGAPCAHPRPRAWGQPAQQSVSSPIPGPPPVVLQQKALQSLPICPARTAARPLPAPGR